MFRALLFFTFAIALFPLSSSAVNYQLKYKSIPPKKKPADPARVAVATATDEFGVKRLTASSMEEWSKGVAAEDSRSRREQAETPAPLSNEQIKARLEGGKQRDPRSPERLEELRQKAAAYKDRQDKFRQDVADWRAERAAQVNAANEKRRIEYNKQVDRHNRIVDAYNVSRAQSFGRLDAAWELQRRTMAYDALLNSGRTYMLPPVFIGAYGHP